MRRSIATRIFLGFATVLVTSALVSVYGVLQVRRIGQGLGQLSTGYFPLARAAGSLEAFQKERERSTDRLLQESDPVARRGLIVNHRTYSARFVAERVQRARELVQSALQIAEARDREPLEVIDARLVGLQTRMGEEEQAFAQLARALEAPAGQKAGPPSELPGVPELSARLKTAERRVGRELKLLFDAIQDQTNRGVAEAERQERDARWAIVSLSLFALAVGLLVTWLSSRALRRIGALTEAAQRLGRGAPDAVAALPERGADELAALAREFNAMAQRLAARERELRAQGEELIRSERLAAIGRIAAQITHEIRNPLSSIGLNAEELGERLRDGDSKAAAPLCDAIAGEVDRLAAITEEYLRFARLPKPQLGRADLNEVVTALVEFVRPELDAAGTRTTLELQPGLPAVSADVGQLRQLLLNLVRNAREAMPGGGALRLTTRAEANLVTLEVRDTGPGIAPERLQRIFDPFFTTKERGTGLGLALAQEIAQEHGGQLTCTSTLGQGTTFTLRLPASQEARAQGPEPRAAAPQPAVARA
jgi:signal transduction histidine kinase